MTDDDGDVLLDLDHVREVGVSMGQLELVHAAFNNHTDPNTGQTFLPDANSVYCAKFYDNVLWFLSGHERLSPQDPLPSNLGLICNQSKSDHVVEISAVVDVDAAESETTSRQSSTQDTSSGDSDNTMIIVTTLVCITFFLVASLGYVAFSKNVRLREMLARRKLLVSSIQVKRAQRERIVQLHKEELDLFANDTKRGLYGGFLKAWDIDPRDVHEWKQHHIGDGQLGPTFYGSYNYDNKTDFDLVRVLLKGLKSPSNKEMSSSPLPSISSSTKDDENENETIKYGVEIDLEMLYRVHEISRHNCFVYIFGAMRSLTPVQGCRWFLVSEELEGNETVQTVAWKFDQNEFPSWFERAHWCVDIANAIQHLHINGYIHGNLKSSNCILYKQTKLRSGMDVAESPMITENKALTDWENHEFRRVRLNDLSYARKIVREDVVNFSSSSSSTSKSIFDLREKMSKLGEELKRMSYLGKDAIYQNKKALYRLYQNELDTVMNRSSEDDMMSSDESTSQSLLRKRLPSSTPSGLRFWHARSKKTLNLNADMIKPEDNDLIPHTPASRLIESTKLLADSKQRWNPWLAPEVTFDSTNPTQRSDMYSLGVILNEIMTLRKPFQDFPWDQNTKEGFAARDKIRRKVITGARPSTYLSVFLSLSLSFLSL